MQDSTIKTPTQKDAEYEKEYAAWLATKTPAELTELRRLGLDKPSLPHPRGNPHGSASAINIENRAHPDDWDGGLEDDDDPETFELEPESEPPALGCGIPQGEAPDTTGVDPGTIRQVVLDTLRRVLGEILQHPNARMTAECLALVTGTCYSGDSEQAIATRHGVERAAISKRCVELADLFDLAPSRAMRTQEVRDIYSQAQLARKKMKAKGGLAA